MIRVLVTLLSITILGCASGNCRQLANEKKQAATNSGSGVTESVSPGAGTPPASAPAPNNKTTPAAKPETVLVYKADGSLQCAMGKSIPVEVMEKELSGIQVFAREKKPDGMMHIQVCGSPTGMMNTYTIPASRLADAEKRGFKKWNF